MAFCGSGRSRGKREEKHRRKRKKRSKRAIGGRSYKESKGNKNEVLTRRKEKRKRESGRP